MPELIFLECSLIEVRVLFSNWFAHQQMCSKALLFIRSVVRYESHLPLFFCHKELVVQQKENDPGEKGYNGQWSVPLKLP